MTEAPQTITDVEDPVAGVHRDLDAIESAVSEGRFEEFAGLSEGLGAALDAHVLQAALIEEPDRALQLNQRLQRLGGVLGYMRALQQALQGLSQPADEAYSASPAAAAERRTAAWEA